MLEDTIFFPKYVLSFFHDQVVAGTCTVLAKLSFCLQVFCGKIPKELYEDELIPLFERCGEIWDLRLMMDPLTGQNRGYAFVTFTSRGAADQAVATVGLSLFDMPVL